MADNLQNRGPQDRANVNIHESWELTYWSDKFGVSKDRLKEAVGKVGTNAARVEQELKK